MGRARPVPLLLFFPTKAVTEVDTAHRKDSIVRVTGAMKWMRGPTATQGTFRQIIHILTHPEHCQHHDWWKLVVPVQAMTFLGPQGMENLEFGGAHSHNLSACICTACLHSLSVVSVTQQHREIQFWMVKSEPGEASGSDSQKANAFDICWTWMKVPKSGCSSGLRNKHAQDVACLSDGHALKCLFTDVQVVPLPDISTFYCFCAIVALLFWIHLDLMLLELPKLVFILIPQCLQRSDGKCLVTEWWESVCVWEGLSTCSGQAVCNHSDAIPCWTNLKAVPGKTVTAVRPNLSYLIFWVSCFQPTSACRGALEEIGEEWVSESSSKALIVATLCPGCQTAEVILCHYVRRRQEWCSEAHFNLMLPWLSLKQISILLFIWEENKKWISFTHPSLEQSWPSVLSAFAVLIILSISIHVVLGS